MVDSSYISLKRKYSDTRYTVLYRILTLDKEKLMFVAAHLRILHC